MIYTDLKLIANLVNNEGFELTFSHPTLTSVLFQGDFDSLDVSFTEDHGSWEQPPSCEIEIDFSIDMSTLEILDNDGEIIESVSKDVIELIECEIREYITDNSGEF